MRIQDLMLRRIRRRNFRPCLPLDFVDISQVTEREWRRLWRRMEFEERVSKELRSHQMYYDLLNGRTQYALERYSEVLECATHAVEHADHKKAIDALDYLRKEAETFRKTVNNLLRTISMSDFEAMDYLQQISSLNNPQVS
jgi:hypothetical protein